MYWESVGTCICKCHVISSLNIVPIYLWKSGIWDTFLYQTSSKISSTFFPPPINFSLNKCSKITASGKFKKGISILKTPTQNNVCMLRTSRCQCSLNMVHEKRAASSKTQISSSPLVFKRRCHHKHLLH